MYVNRFLSIFLDLFYVCMQIFVYVNRLSLFLFSKILAFQATLKFEFK